MCQFLRRKQATQGSSHYVRLLLSYLLWRMGCWRWIRGSPGTQRGDSYYSCSGPRPDTSLHITSQNNAKQPPLLFLLPDLRTSRRQVKQHFFDHIESLLGKTLSEYIQWRFQTGEDRETMDRASRQINENDAETVNKIFKIDGSQRRIAGVHARRKFKNTYEYECSFLLGENVGQKNENVYQ